MAKASDIKVGEKIYDARFFTYLGTVVGPASQKGYTTIDHREGPFYDCNNRKLATQAQRDAEMKLRAEKADRKATMDVKRKEANEAFMHLSDVLGKEPVSSWDGERTIHSSGVQAVYVLQAHGNGYYDYNTVKIKTDLLARLVEMAGIQGVDIDAMLAAY